LELDPNAGSWTSIAFEFDAKAVMTKTLRIAWLGGWSYSGSKQRGLYGEGIPSAGTLQPTMYYDLILSGAQQRLEIQRDHLAKSAGQNLLRWSHAAFRLATPK